MEKNQSNFKKLLKEENKNYYFLEEPKSRKKQRREVISNPVDLDLFSIFLIFCNLHVVNRGHFNKYQAIYTKKLNELNGTAQNVTNR